MIPSRIALTPAAAITDGTSPDVRTAMTMITAVITDTTSPSTKLYHPDRL
jgi:hypothetical protein